MRSFLFYRFISPASRRVESHTAPRHFLLLVLALLLAATAGGHAQTSTADVLGTVTDVSGAFIPGAIVRLQNLETHQTRETRSSENGTYAFTQLQPGTYSLTVTATGFKGFANPGLLLVAGDRARVDAPLQIGATSETVEVTAQPSALQTDSTNVGSTVEAKAIADLPLNGRNVFGLVQVAPGVNAGSPTSMTSGTRPDDRRQSSSISANGQYELVNNQLLDGLDNNERFKGLILLRPSVEAIQTVRVDTNTYTAEVGRTAGAAVTILTKAGTDQFHGSIYEFFRNDITDARNYFARTMVLAHKPELRQNQFGGSIGGPIRRGKTFFFADLEEFRQVDATGTVYTSTVPTLYQQQHPGDLSDVGGPVVTNVDPTALAYFRLYPTPNQPGTAFTPGVSVPTNNYLYKPARTQNSTLGDLRIDHHFGTNDTLFARYSYNDVKTFVPGPFPNVAGVASGNNTSSFPGSSVITTHNGQLGYTHIFSSKLVMDLRTGYTLFLDHVTPVNYGANLNTGTSYSIPNANACLECSGLSPITPGTGYTGLGDATFLPILLNEGTYQYAGNLTYIHGNHTLKFGGALIRRLVSNLQQNFGKPSITFTGSTPQQALARFFAGQPFNYQRQGLTRRPHVRTWEENIFVQDDWRILPSLTVNLGVRYDIFSAPNEKDGYFSNLDLNTLTLVTNQTGGIKTNYANIAPRIGFAESITPTFVIRGGFGLTFYANDIQNAFYLQNPPYSFATGTLTSTTALSSGVAAAPASSSTTALSGAVWSKPFGYRNAYVEQFNLLMQKDLRGNVVTIGYVGELGRHLNAQIPNINLPAPSGSATVPGLVYASQLPNVNTIQYFGSFAASNYHSLQTSFERRLSHGLTINGNYTFAHTLDNTNNQGTEGDAGYGLQPAKVSTYDYGNSTLDVRHRIAVTANYAIPFRSANRITQAALGNWQVNALSFWQTGTPFAITSAVTQNGRAYINLPTVTVDRPDLIGNPFLDHPTPITGFLNPAAFARQAIGTAGNAGRNIMHGPHQRRTDLSLFKSFPIRDTLNLQLRAECFNISNTPNFALPNGQISSYSATPDANGRYVATAAGNFGISTSTATGSAARQFQFAAKITF
ncbi:MAG: TonB-dependent receptor [Acidobacteriaceae bacterium]|nr:TonB-dependent receptor [Acidobacteriaceae bacterium]